MIKNNISNYFKLATILLLDVLPFSFMIALFSAKESDFAGFGIIMLLFYLLICNFGAFILYKLTKRIKNPVLRDILFYFLLLSLFLCPSYFFLY
jgi:hypothetical protein